MRRRVLLRRATVVRGKGERSGRKMIIVQADLEEIAPPNPTEEVEIAMSLDMARNVAWEMLSKAERSDREA